MKLLVLTIGRTGHNSIIEWVKGQMTGSIIHHTDCYINNNKIHPKSTAYFGGKSGNIFDNTIYTVERFSLDSETCEKLHMFNADYCLLVNRDSYNLIASMYKILIELKVALDKSDISNDYKHHGVIVENVLNMWKSHVKESLGYTHKIKIDFIDVNFNNYVSDIEYRKLLSNKMNLIFNDKNLGIVPINGGGSSFNKLTIQDGRKLRILERYNFFLTDVKYIELFDDEMINLNEQYFKMKNPFK